MELTLLWVLGIVVMATARIPKEQFPACPKECLCGRGSTGSFDVTCPKLDDSRFNVQYVAKDSFKISCYREMKESDLGMLRGLNVGPVNTVSLQMCPVEPIAKLFEDLNVTSVKTFTVQLLNLTNAVDKLNFNGLRDVSRLIITSSGASVIPEDYFQEFTNLTSLDLRGNDIKELPLRIFDSLSNLTSLELGQNKITQLTPGIFRNQAKLTLLNLWSNSLKNLTRKVFENLNSLESLDLHSNGLVSLPDDVFDDLSALKTLNLMSNNFSTLPNGLFSGTPKLEKLFLYYNRQRLSLPSRFFENLSNMKTLSLNSNNMSQLSEDALWGCTSLETLYLQNNALTEIPMTLLRDATSLQKLDVSFNQLESLPKQIFSSLAKLEILLLNNNRLTNIPAWTFGSLLKLEELNMEHNQISHIDSESFARSCQLKKLRLAHNQLTFQQSHGQDNDPNENSPLHHCLKLEEIYLANNSIGVIFSDWRTLMGRLTMLDLKHNNITYVESSHLQFLVKKLVVDLSNNRIHDLDLRTLESVVLLGAAQPGQSVQNVKVIVKNNPLQCDCQMYDLLRYIEHKMDPQVYQFVELVTDGLNCSSPEDVAGVSVAKLDSTKITCELNTANMGKEECPIPCKCYGRPDDKALVIDCADVGLRTAPMRLPQLDIWISTELHLEKNWLRSLPNVKLPGYHRVKKLYVSHNNLTRLELANIPPNIEVLQLDHNNLTHIDAETLNVLANETKTKLKEIHLYNNPWVCDCDARDLLNFIQNCYKQVDMLQHINCTDGRPLPQLSADDLCPVSNNLIIAASVTIATLGIIVGALAALYYRYQQEIKVWLYARNLCLWFVTEEELDKDKHYDAFISYSHKDEEFVTSHLVPGLESGPSPFKLCLHYRDWIAGDWIPNQIARSVEDSRRTMVILSPNFLESVWGRMEFRAAHSQALSEGRARVIVVLYGEIGPVDELDPELRAYLSMNTYVKWGDPWFWDKLRYALPHPPGMAKRAAAIAKQPELRIKTNYDDKVDLMVPTTPNATTPPADKVINPMIDANGHIVIPLTATNGHVQLLKETNGHANGCVKSI